MAGNVFGRFFRVTTWGESHGSALGCVIDGCPSGVKISVEEVQRDLDRRRPGQSSITTPRKESDICEILSGMFEGKTTGTPISVIIRNENSRSEDYKSLANLWRPSHADFTYDKKYGIRDYRGGGRSSARETVARVAAGAFAKKCLRGVEIRAWVESVHSIVCPHIEGFPSFEEVERSIVRCPHEATSNRMEEIIKKAKAEGDSLGGIIRCRIKGVPIGLGDPVFDRLEGDLAKGMMSIPAAKGFEIGSGFAGTRMYGSKHNDEIYLDRGEVKFRTNNAGGVLGGISNGDVIDFRVGFKPTATILKKQKTLGSGVDEVEFEGVGRHDPCVLPRAVSIVEAMAALVLVDAWLSDSENLSLRDL